MFLRPSLEPRMLCSLISLACSQQISCRVSTTITQRFLCIFCARSVHILFSRTHLVRLEIFYCLIFPNLQHLNEPFQANLITRDQLFAAIDATQTYVYVLFSFLMNNQLLYRTSTLIDCYLNIPLMHTL